jgi:hypothetical protein
MQLFIRPSSEIAKIHGKRKKYLYHYQKVLYQHQDFSEIVLFFSDVGTPYTILPPFLKKKTSRCFRTSHQTMWDDISTPKHNTGLGVHAT